VAGTIRFTFWKFLLADGLAAVVSGGLFLMLGYYFGRKMEELRQNVEQAKKWMLLGALVLAVGLTVWILIRRRGSSHGSEEPLEKETTAQPAGAPTDH
jgi:membrane protein DedA with SNARE-associated domain